MRLRNNKKAMPQFLQKFEFYAANATTRARGEDIITVGVKALILLFFLRRLRLAAWLLCLMWR